MNWIDYIIIGSYIAGMILLSIFVGRGQKSREDYYVGGRKLPWWAIGISTMATQTSAVSFISIPAFVALKAGGGLTWLQYELGVPVAMVVVITILIPYLRQLKLISIYEYLELRFNVSVRKLVSLVFLISRGIATGAGVYAVAAVLEVVFPIPEWIIMASIGIIMIIYDTIGGIKAVIYSDVIQTVILIGGIFLCICYSISQVGGMSEIISSFPAERLSTFDFSSGLSGDSDVPFWAYLFGGIFLYMSYYGTDQSQVQRELSAKSIKETKKSLLFNGIARFPLTLLYIALGIALYTVFIKTPELQAQIAGSKNDNLVPYYILSLPVGFRGLLFASILAAAMSSLDSAINSLSAITMQDFFLKTKSKTRNELRTSRLITIFWGIFITCFAFVVGDIADTIIEAINKIGSAFYGPILASFIIGILSKREFFKRIFVGIIAGVLFSLILWLFMPDVHWMWWNLFGFLVTVAVSCLPNLFGKKIFKEFNYEQPDIKNIFGKNARLIIILVAYFCVLLLILYGINLLK